MEAEAKPFRDTIDAGIRAQVRALLTLLRKVENDEVVDATALAEILVKTGINSHDATKQILKEKSARDSRGGEKPAIRRIPIQSTTVQSSKGLAEDYVFITHFDDQYFLRDKGKIGDRDICNFLVALTRARQKVFLISSQKKDPAFLKWIKPERIDVVFSLMPPKQCRGALFLMSIFRSLRMGLHHFIPASNAPERATGRTDDTSGNQRRGRGNAEQGSNSLA